MFDRSILASATGEFIDSNLAINAVKQALKQARNAKKIILHSDQGSQFTSKKFAEFCKTHNLVQSMSRAGKPTDNAPMERFFCTLKCEFYYLFNFDNIDTLRKCLDNYIFVRYNYSRPHSFNGGLSPMQRRLNYFRAKKSA